MTGTDETTKPINQVIVAPGQGKVRTDYHHPDKFQDGVRLLMLKSRHKDGWVGKERSILRQSSDIVSFNRYLDELRSLIKPGERIYASASPRDVLKGGRLFAERMANAMFDPPEVREDFFKRLQYHWWSSLMQPQTQIRDQKWWMWDCDDEAAFNKVRMFMTSGVMSDHYINKPSDTYVYKTKAGWHYLCRPFDRGLIPDYLPMSPDTNPLMLWSYL